MPLTIPPWWSGAWHTLAQIWVKGAPGPFTTRKEGVVVNNYDPGISPNWVFFPFMDKLKNAVGG